VSKLSINDISELRNFSMNEQSTFGDPIFGKADELDRDGVFFLDRFTTWIKRRYRRREGFSLRAGRCIVHDFNMRKHDGQDHPKGIAYDVHFSEISLRLTVFEAIAFGWQKIFFYPEWDPPGVHLAYYPEWTKLLLGYGHYKRSWRNGKVIQEQHYITNTWKPVEVYRMLCGESAE